MTAIPQTSGALLGFLGLIAPGLTYELLYERRCPGARETVFREAGRVALLSLFFTVASSTVLLILANWWQALPDLGAWIREGNAYLAHHYGAVVLAFALEIVLACGLATIFGWLPYGRPRGHISNWSVWFQELRAKRPEETNPWLHVKLSDGTEVYGHIGGFATQCELADRELSLIGPGLRLIPAGGEPVHLDDWSAVVVHASQMVFMKLTYIDKVTGDIVGFGSQPRRKPTGKWSDDKADSAGETDTPLTGVSG